MKINYPDTPSIPEHLLLGQNYAEFISWICRQKLPNFNKRIILHNYTEETGKRFHITQVATILNPDEVENVTPE